MKNLRIALIFIVVFPLLFVIDVLKIVCFNLSEFFGNISRVLYKILEEL
jgi:hypothetical protein